MLLIYVPNKKRESVDEIICSVDRLNELVTIEHVRGKIVDNSLLINDDTIRFAINWGDTAPPYYIPTLKFTPDNLLGCIFFLLGNNEKTWEYFKGDGLMLKHFSVFELLAGGYTIEKEVLDFVEKPSNYPLDEKYHSLHNSAIIYHYGNLEEGVFPENHIAGNRYLQAIQAAISPEQRAFSSRHYSIFLMDQEKLSDAENIIRNINLLELPKRAIPSVRSILIDILLRKLVFPYDNFLMGETKSLIREAIEHEQNAGDEIGEALCLIKASHISQLEKNYSEGLTCINKAISAFERFDYKEFFAEAMRKKGMLLYSWAQEGNPQFYKSAMESFQRALQHFTKENAPAVFADINHHLGIIYAKLPVEEKKKGLMAGISTTAFQEAMEYYSKDRHPYEYAAICTHYGNALCNYPPAKHSDNFKKALFYYSEALEIRNQQFPVERALTLLNYLEASWNIRTEAGFDEERYQDMKQKAQEVLDLVSDGILVQEAKNHLKNLDALITAKK